MVCFHGIIPMRGRSVKLPNTLWPSGYLRVRHGKWPIYRWFSQLQTSISMAMLNNQRVSNISNSESWEIPMKYLQLYLVILFSLGNHQWPKSYELLNPKKIWTPNHPWNTFLFTGVLQMDDRCPFSTRFVYKNKGLKVMRSSGGQGRN